MRQTKVKDKESLIRALHEAVRLGEVEKVKRFADAAYEAGIDPIAILTNIVLTTQPDSPLRSVAVCALETLDSAALKKIEVPPPTADTLQESEELGMDAPAEPSEEPASPEEVFHFLIKEKEHPVTAEEIEALLIDQSITAESLTCCSDSLWRPIRDFPQLGMSIRNACNALHGPQTATKRVEHRSLPDIINCHRGRHKFEEWRYVGDASCEARWFCEHCNKTMPSEVQHHVYGAIGYLKGGECAIGRPCLRCSHGVIQDIRHEWEEWSFPNPGSCNTVRICSRCGVVEKGEVRHDEWEEKFPNRDSCCTTLTCVRCGIVKTGDVKHDFETWRDHDECTYVRNCRRCNEYDFSKHHSWGVWSESTSSCQQVRVCKRCGGEDKESIEHKWGIWTYESPVSCLQVRFCRRCHERDEGSTEHKWLWIGTTGTCSHCGKII
jgi:hypothetical protein